MASTSAELRAMRRPAVPTAAIANALPPRLVDHVVDGDDGAFQRRGDDLAGSLQALAQSRDLRSIDDGAPASVRLTLRDLELHRVGADVDDRVAAGRPRPWPAGRGVAGVDEPVQADLANGPQHGRTVLRLDGIVVVSRRHVTSVTSDVQPLTR